MVVQPCPFVQKYIAELKQHPREYSYSGLQCSTPDSSSHSALPATGDRFTVHTPYCKGYLRWEVVFNAQRPDLPPDLILEDNAQWFDLARCTALIQWTSDSSFTRLLDEVLAQHAEYHEHLVRHHPNERLRYEYNTICGIPGVEYHVSAPKVRMMIPLGVELGPVFQVLLNSASGAEYCRYFVEFTATEGGALQVSHADVQWPTRLVPFAWLIDHPFPSFTLERGGCLVQFIPELEDSIARLVNATIDRLNRRRELCEALMTVFGHALEYDAHRYSHVCFLFDAKVAFIMHVSLGDGTASYPTAPPVVQLASLGATEIADGRAVAPRCRVQQFPFSPDMTALALSQAIQTRLAEIQPEFMEVCLAHKSHPLT
eukprot:GGOE01017788.1.p1 GENE.GGOE01017788.1~~GGOE01017788.1.p1  ORF type:complete len:372 (-),score=92.22 GGOE01017788.1:119-1234(-)